MTTMVNPYKWFAPFVLAASLVAAGYMLFVPSKETTPAKAEVDFPTQICRWMADRINPTKIIPYITTHFYGPDGKFHNDPSQVIFQLAMGREDSQQAGLYQCVEDYSYSEIHFTVQYQVIKYGSEYRYLIDKMG